MTENLAQNMDVSAVPEHVCGIDVHKTKCNYVLLERERPIAERPAMRRKFARKPLDITRAINWCREWNVTSVAMESSRCKTGLEMCVSNRNSPVVRKYWSENGDKADLYSKEGR